MTDFEFYNPVRVFFGKDLLPKIAAQIPAGNKVMLLYGGGSILRNGVYKKVKDALERFEVTDFEGIEPNPTYETCMKAVEIIRENNIGFLLAVGGGSVIDATKFIAAAARYRFGDPWNILAKNMPVVDAVPLGTVLTLPATGSEMNSNSVISRKSTEEKLSFGSPMVFPRFSFLLPEAAGSLPPRQVANGIVDAFIHVIEQYLTYPVNSPVQDRFAEAILVTLIEQGPLVYSNPADYEAMSNLMWSATMALNGLIGRGVPGDWSVHSIGHELTALHGIDHARTLAIVLPGLWKALREEKKEKLLQYGERVWKISEGSEEERIDAAIERTVEFFESLGVPTRLGTYGVTNETIDRIVTRFEERKWIALGDRGLTTPEVTRKALELQL
ncbi:MAG: iron-containing alcohol dehydrogenase [Bacteroidales bacterium]|jgi:NADP-dependent alcohol dehydrogenase|nr:iron-containing alcohol dehydrogenase [Bacteroidales bacterium]